MATKLEGAEWEKKLRYIVYDADGNVLSKSEYSDLQGLIDILTSKNTKIKTICCLATRLKDYNKLQTGGKIINKLNIFKAQAKHHFVEMESETGEFYTIEKEPHVYILQKSPAPKSRFTLPMVRQMRNEERRLPEEKMHQMETIVEDDQPKDETVLRVIKWIRFSNLLDDPYHLGKDNCQHFAALIWSQLSKKPMPNPGKFGKPIPQMEDMKDENAAGAAETIRAEEPSGVLSESPIEDSTTAEDASTVATTISPTDSMPEISPPATALESTALAVVEIDQTTTSLLQEAEAAFDYLERVNTTSTPVITTPQTPNSSRRASSSSASSSKVSLTTTDEVVIQVTPSTTTIKKTTMPVQESSQMSGTARVATSASRPESSSQAPTPEVSPMTAAAAALAVHPTTGVVTVHPTTPAAFSVHPTAPPMDSPPLAAASSEHASEATGTDTTRVAFQGGNLGHQEVVGMKIQGNWTPEELRAMAPGRNLNQTVVYNNATMTSGIVAGRLFIKK